eukprot:gnl/TRDRNA2_/TRDRNA2_203495_c0_seq1.p1 gnl/TRDRNA2_/TRDRNA2_203495_c0~~gnl/TRDRNA2_/TRDRNA2_203495_c0_seq1.p1  ORF type:complete len:310 (-),score=47.00 gnl/TRDRNA2_/TRDRNA2_203495_c0_seq1:104-916(-)
MSQDGPGRFDLPLDLRGQWLLESMTGCDEYMAVTGTKHFAAGPTTCSILLTANVRQIVYQDCLEMTVTGSTDMGAKSPLHHMVLNDKYITDDWTAAGMPAMWTSKIVAAGPSDVEAASPVVVFEEPAATQTSKAEGLPEGARRYLDTTGRLVMAWTVLNETSTVSFRLKFTKEMDLPCKGYDPTECADRTYTDGVGSAGWTPSCCLDAYGSHQPNPNQRACEGQALSTPEPQPKATPEPQPNEPDSEISSGTTRVYGAAVATVVWVAVHW